MTSDTSSPRALMRVIGIFEAIAEVESGLALVELSQRLASPKSSLLLLLRPLVAQGYLTHADGRYRLGPAAFRMAGMIVAARRLPAQIRAALEWLAAETEETVILTAIDPSAGMVNYLEVIPSQQPIRYVVPAGSSRPLYPSAAGRVLLAHQGEAWREAYLASTELKPITSHTKTKLPELRRVIEEARKAGVCTTFEETILGASGCAAPIYDADVSVSMALLVGGPADRMRRNFERVRTLTREAAIRASSGTAPAPMPETNVVPVEAARKTRAGRTAAAPPPSRKRAGR